MLNMLIHVVPKRMGFLNILDGISSNVSENSNMVDIFLIENIQGFFTFLNIENYSLVLICEVKKNLYKKAKPLFKTDSY